MPKFNNTQQSPGSWWERKGEDMVNLVLGLAITFFVAWGLYIGINLHL
jgi:hypothetical protein